MVATKPPLTTALGMWHRPYHLHGHDHRQCLSAPRVWGSTGSRYRNGLHRHMSRVGVTHNAIATNRDRTILIAASGLFTCIAASPACIQYSIAAFNLVQSASHSMVSPPPSQSSCSAKTNPSPHRAAKHSDVHASVNSYCHRHKLRHGTPSPH